MRDIVREVFVAYFTQFGFPQDTFKFDLNSDEVEKFVRNRRQGTDPVLIADIKNCRVNSGNRTTSITKDKIITLVGLGEYRIVLDILGYSSKALSDLEGKICASTNFYFEFEGYKECKILVEDITYGGYTDYLGKLWLKKTSIELKLLFPLFRLEELSSIKISDIKLYIAGRS
ncbi:hypothetical protein [Borrelia sp. RT1S]|uniref:hypothetical protein n=1 Tax=Borrelia sp. RT1S TaxID=2898580 RepID=UPI001E5833E2|nr:hypothetical protein [Borrelia sp. RT1S]UGQ17874.1 hypothetical protein LSO05_05430 [Borrelia sp. RT1S]